MENLNKLEIVSLLNSMKSVEYNFTYEISPEHQLIWDKFISNNWKTTRKGLLGNVKYLPVRIHIPSGMAYDFFLLPYAENDIDLLKRNILTHFRNFKRGQNNKFTQQSIYYESLALDRYSRFTRRQIKAGITIINPNMPFICAKPDGFIIENDAVVAVVEVKCPQGAYTQSIHDYLYSNKSNMSRSVVKRNGKYMLTSKYNRFYVQCQLCIVASNLNVAHLVLYSTYDESFAEIIIERDDDYIEEMMTTLEYIYITMALPCLATKFYI